MRLITRKLAGLTLCAVSLVATGCGDENDDAFINTFNPGLINTNTFGNNQFAGRYLGTTNVNGQQGTLDLSVGPSGQATGTLTFGGQQVTMRVLGMLLTGPYTFTGSVDPNTGSFLLQGEVPGLGPVVVTGTLPRGNAQGNFQFTVGGQTFSGPIQNAQLGVPNNNNNGGGQNTGNQRLISSGTLSNFTFTEGGGYNGVNPPVTPSSLVTGTVTQNGPDNGVFIVISEVFVGGNPARVRSLTFGVDTNGNNIEVGRTYNLITANGQEGAIVSLQETNGPTIERAWTQGTGATGTVRVTSLTSTTIDVEFNFSNVGPNAETPGSAQGTFSTSGTVRGNFAPQI